MLLRLLSSAIAVTLALSLPSYAGASDDNAGPPAGADQSSLFYPGNAEHAFVAIEKAIGHDFDVIGVSITRTHLLVDAITDAAAGKVETWQVAHSGLIGALGLDLATRVTDESAVTQIGSLEDNRFALGADKLSIVPKLVADAIARARLETPGKVTEMELRRLPKIVGGRRDPIWQIHVEGAGEEADFGADMDGKITSSDLRRTNHANHLDLLAAGPDFEAFIARIRDEAGRDWVFHRIEIEQSAIGFDVHLASGKASEIKHFNATLSGIQTTAFDIPHTAFPGDPVDEPFAFNDVDFGLLAGLEQGAKDKLGFGEGVIKRVIISRPHHENGASIEWEVEVGEANAPIFQMPGQPERREGSATFDGKGNFLRAKYPKGEGPAADLFRPDALQAAVAAIAQQLGAHAEIVELQINQDQIRITAADPKLKAKLVLFQLKDGIVARMPEAFQGLAAVFGDGPDWRWDIATLTPEVFQRLADMEARAAQARNDPNAHISGIAISKDKQFHPGNQATLIQVETEAAGQTDTMAFDLTGRAPKLAEAKSGVFVGGQNGEDEDATTCGSSRDPQAVIAACTRTLEGHPDAPARARAVGYYDRGNAYMDLNQWNEAIADFSQAIEIDPRHASAYQNRAFVYAMINDAEHASADASKVIELEPKNAKAYKIRGLSEEALGKWDAAIADFTQQIALVHSDDHAYYNRGFAEYSGKGELDRAIADFSQAIKLNPKQVDAFVYRGIAWRLKGDIQRAIADHGGAIRVDPRNGAAFFNRGMEYYLTGALPQALADLSQATALAPKEAYPALLLDLVTTRSGVASSLKEQSDKLDMGAWPAPAIRLLLGQLTPDALLAAAEDGDATRKAGRLCEAKFYAGVSLARAGKPTEASGKWREALASCPPHAAERGYADVELKALKLVTK